MPSPPPAFDFGQNWSEFSDHALTAEKVGESRAAFAKLMDGIPLPDRTLIDIGFGQGLGLLSACELGARGIGCDINPKCSAVLAKNLRHFPALAAPPPVVVGSILDPTVVAKLRSVTPTGAYDIVHSWGVLHHTGDMKLALRHASSLVAPTGHFVIAIYNRHWSSRAWKTIKHFYVLSPRWLQRALVSVLLPVIYAAKWIVTGRNPRQQERGMDFYYDVIDWVGGYPYEYASPAEIKTLLRELGFELHTWRAAQVPTGCNEFIFQRRV